MTRIAGVPPGWTNRAVGLEAIASDSASGMEASGDGPRPFTAIRVDDGAPAIAFGDTAAASVIAEGAHRVAYYARDAAGNVDDGATVGGIRDRAPREAWVRIDRTPPGAAFPNSQDPRDPELIRVRIADPLSGADPSRGWIGVRRAGSGDPYERLPAAPPADGELRARWDSDGVPPGDYEFAALAYDAAGNSTLTTTRARRLADGPRQPAEDDDEAPRRLPPRPQADRPLRAPRPRTRTPDRRRAYAARRRSGAGNRTVRAGRAPGDPRVDRANRPGRTLLLPHAARAEPHDRARLSRQPDPGAFGLRGRCACGCAGESACAPHPARRWSAAAPLVFRGRVVAAPGTIPRKGMPVRLQFRLGRSPWSAFRTIQTDSRGRFRYSYRFSDDDSRGARFQFRAYLPADENWPYAPAGSRPVLVTGK